MEEQSYYGAPASQESSISIWDRLRKLYEPEDFVSVINIDTQPLVYQFASPSDVETLSSGPGQKDTVQHKIPRVIRLEPGQIKLCPAYEADKMIETLVKQICNRNVNDKIERGEISRQSTSDWNNPEVQSSLIRKIFLGKQDIYSMQAPKTVSVEEDLGNEAPRRPGRPRRED